jgi:hypothetical protein
MRIGMESMESSKNRAQAYMDEIHKMIDLALNDLLTDATWGDCDVIPAMIDVLSGIRPVEGRQYNITRLAPPYSLHTVLLKVE